MRSTVEEIVFTDALSVGPRGRIHLLARWHDTSNSNKQSRNMRRTVEEIVFKIKSEF